MKNLSLVAALILGVSFGACTNQKADSAAPNNQTKPSNVMKNPVSIIEIPTADFTRAVKFYQAILNIKIEEIEMEGIRMGSFPNAGEGIVVQLIHGGAYKPSSDGALVYLNGEPDLQKIADKITANGGSIVVPKTEIGPDMGFYAIFTDTEGNKLGLHSYK